MREAFGDWEIDLAHAIVDIANQLERIADALESYVYEDDEENDEENDEKVDPSDGVFLPQDDENDDGFADRPDIDSEDFEQ